MVSILQSGMAVSVRLHLVMPEDPLHLGMPKGNCKVIRIERIEVKEGRRIQQFERWV